MECPLLLTTLSGVTFKVSLSVAKFDRFTDLEDQVMDYLASVTDLKVFGCVIDFLHTTTQTYLEDPIWDKLQQGKEYTIVFRDCSVTLPEQEQLGGYSIPLAVHVPMNPEEIVPGWKLTHGDLCKVDAPLEEVLPEIGFPIEHVYSSTRCIHTLQETAFRKGFVTKVATTRSQDTI